jgi:nucleoside-diphosphate-sugar epimerase
MKVLVTGASGFTGSHLANALVQRGYDVYGFVRPTSNVSTLSPKITLLQGDLTSQASVDRAVQGMDIVYHIAATYRDSGVSQQTYYDVNVMGTRHVIAACLAHKVNRMVHCSTVGVHGHIENPPANEHSPFNPGDEYQRTKLEAEKWVAQSIQDGLPATIFRPAGIFGPGDKRFLKLFRTIKNRTFIMFGSGEVLYHLIYIDDLVQGIILCGEKPEALGKIYIIAGKQAVTLNELSNSVARVLGVQKPKWRIPFWVLWQASVLCEDVCKPLGLKPPLFRRRADFFRKSRSFDTSKIQKDLGFQPKINLEEGLHQTATWYKANNLI